MLRGDFLGYGRYLLFRAANTSMVLIAVVLVSAVIFNVAIEKQIVADIDEQIRAWLRTPEAARMSQEERENYIKVWRETEYEKYGLNQPVWIRIFYRTAEILTFQFGRASVMKSPTGSSEVVEIILEALPQTILLFTTATIIEIFIGLYLGFKAARGVGGVLDRTISIFAMFSNSLPMWWFGMLMIFFFSYQLNLFPSSGMFTVPPVEKIVWVIAIPYVLPPVEIVLTGTTAKIIDLLWHMTLPLATVVFVSFGAWTYVTRNIVVGTLQEDFVMAARAKGLPERKVLYGHVLRTASPPIVTMSILSLIGSLGGAIITESVFTWPGMGRLYWIALQQGDLRVLLGLTFITTFIFVVAMVLVDLIYGFLDPRVKVGSPRR
jgi:peptide/nickel transport system permease protein